MPNQMISLVGDAPLADSYQINYDSMLNTNMATPVSIYAGTGAPTFSAAKGSIYTNITGSSVATRMYVNTNGSTTWTNVTTAA